MFSAMRQMTLRFCRLLPLVRANNTPEGRARSIPLFFDGFCMAARITWRTSGLEAGHVATSGFSRRGTNPKVLRLRLKERQLGADRSSHAVAAGDHALRPAANHHIKARNASGAIEFRPPEDTVERELSEFGARLLEAAPEKERVEAQ
jgi:hypothetical protein